MGHFTIQNLSASPAGSDSDIPASEHLSLALTKAWTTSPGAQHRSSNIESPQEEQVRWLDAEWPNPRKWLGAARKLSWFKAGLWNSSDLRSKLGYLSLDKSWTSLTFTYLIHKMGLIIMRPQRNANEMTHPCVQQNTSPSTWNTADLSVSVSSHSRFAQVTYLKEATIQQDPQEQSLPLLLPFPSHSVPMSEPHMSTISVLRK